MLVLSIRAAVFVLGCVCGCNRSRLYKMASKKLYRYTKETLLGFASLPSCQCRPDGIDAVLWRDSITSDVVEGNIAIPVVSTGRGLVRRDSDLAYSKSPVDDLPEWRRPNGGGAILQSGPRRKAYEDEPVGNAFSSSYPPRPSGPWVEQNGLGRSPQDRGGPVGPPGPPGRWDRNGDRDRERGRIPQEWDGDGGEARGKGDASQRHWVERDGLLGSGNRPPSQGHIRIGRPADNYPAARPLIKTPVYGRRENTDTVNDETFGFLESSHDDRSVEERKRRESFEMMRKEQHRHLQEQKQPATKSEKSSVNRKHDENSLWDNHSHQSPPPSPIGKMKVATPAPTPPRPAVPPGFSRVVEQRVHANQTPSQQEDDLQGPEDLGSKDAGVVEQRLLDSEKGDDCSSGDSSSSVGDIKEVKCATPVAKEMIVELDVVETKGVVTEATGDSGVNGSLFSVGSSSAKRSAGAADMWSFGAEAQDGESISDVLSMEDAGSIRKESLLDKLFGNAAAPTVIDDVVLPSDLLKDEPVIAAPDEENWSGSLSKTSKFAHWFNAEEDKFPTSQRSSSKDLLSLFGSSERGSSHGALEKDVQIVGGLGSSTKAGFSVVLPMPVGPSLEDIERGLTGMGEVPNTNKHNVVKNGVTGSSMAQRKQVPSSGPVFMTCEDIEQALLAEAAGSGSEVGRSRGPAAVAVVESAPKDAASASQHLLSLLLKRPPSSEGGLASNGMGDVSAKGSMEQGWKKAEASNNGGNSVHTLESLFGKAFMSELQSSEAATPGGMFSDAGLTRQKREVAKTGFAMQSGGMNQQARSNGMDVPREWVASSGPGWNNMWPDSKDVEAGGFLHMGHPGKESLVNHMVHDDFEDRMASAPPIPGLWGKAEAMNGQSNAFMDGLNGATAHLGGGGVKQGHHEGVVKNSRALATASLQHMGASQVQRNQQRTSAGSGNANYPHPALRPQAQGGGAFNSNGLDVGFDGFPAQQHRQASSHSFHGPISHPGSHIMGQPQILQRPQLHYGMVMQEQELFQAPGSGGGGVGQVAPGHHMHGQQLQQQANQVGAGGFGGPFQSEFQRARSKSPTSGGYGGAGSVERWFGMDGRRSGLLGPNSVFPVAPLGVEGDMLRYG